MAAENFKLIVITPEKDVREETQILNALFETGLQILHLRKPAYTLHETKKLINSISPAFHPNIVLHMHYELLHDFELKGAHLPEIVRKEKDVSRIKNIVSTSFHTLEDITAEKKNFLYAFFGPVFQSISKQGYESSVDQEKIRDFFQINREIVHYPIIALGGITDENILQAADMGFAGAATMGYIWENPNPVEHFNKLKKVLRH